MQVSGFSKRGSTYFLHCYEDKRISVKTCCNLHFSNVNASNFIYNSIVLQHLPQLHQLLQSNLYILPVCSKKERSFLLVLMQ